MLNVNRPLVAVLRHNARQHLVERVATLLATGLKVQAIAGDHGSGLHGFGVHVVPMPLNTGKFGLESIAELHRAMFDFSSNGHPMPQIQLPPR
jgi:hypothetical protein